MTKRADSPCSSCEVGGRRGQRSSTQQRCLTWVTLGFGVAVSPSSGCLLADQDLPEQSCSGCWQEPSFACAVGRCIAETSETSELEGPDC